MTAFAEFFYKLFKTDLAGGTEKGALWLPVISAIALALFVILIITFICVAVHNRKAAKKRDELKSKLDSKGSVQDAESLRAEVEEDVRTQLSAEYEGQIAELQAQLDQANNLAAQNEQASAMLRQKDEQIAELNAALTQANSSAARQTDSSVELNRTVADLNKQISSLRAENNELRALLAKAKSEPAPKQKPAPKQQPIVIPTTQPTTKERPQSNDEDEYDNEFGDETSAIKVTLKYDKAKGNWVIYRSDIPRAYRRMGTKQDALPIAKDLAKRLHAQLVVHKLDGKFQKV